MSAQSHSRLIFACKSLSRAAAVIVIVVGFLVLVGWILDIAPLKSVIAGWATMKVNTAVGFVVAGVALWLAQTEPTDQSRKPQRRAIAQCCGGIVALLGVLTLGEYLAGWDLGIDQLLVRESLETAGTSFPGRMAPATALGFLLLGVALVLQITSLSLVVTQSLTLTVLLMASLALVGYLYGVRSLYGVFAYSSVALHTAAMFVVLSVGVLLVRPDRGLVGIVTSDNVGSVMARRLFPVAMGVPFLLGWLRLMGQRAGLYDTETGVALLALSSMIVLTALVGWNASLMNRMHTERAEGRFRLAVEAAPNAMLMVDQAGKIQLVNTQAEKLFGYPRTELIGQAIEILVPQRFRPQHPGHRASFFANPQGQARAMGAGRDLYGLRKDGTEVPVEIGLNPMTTAEGTFVMASIIDITERKKLEQRVSERTAQLEAANKDLEAFSYSVSHDLRAPLRAINGFSRILREEHTASLPPEAQRYLQLVRDNARQMGQLVDDLLAFSRLGRQALNKQRVAPADIARQALDGLWSEQDGRRIEISIEDLPPCEADPGLLKQVFVNLLSNALKFTRKRDVAVVGIGCRKDGENPDQCVYFVRDNGVGFDMRYADKLFGVFQRLHPAVEYEGTGVGLAIVQRIIHRHGGRVWAQADVNKGATLYFTLEGGSSHD